MAQQPHDWEVPCPLCFAVVGEECTTHTGKRCDDPHLARVIARGKEAPEAVVDYAIEVACESPCQKSKRGAVLFMGGIPIGAAHNGPPPGYECKGDSDCRRVCGKRCMHAEERVFVRADPRIKMSECEMLHVRVRDGLLMPSGPPSCWQCSRTMVDLGLAGMWLYHETGWRRYTAKEFNDLTLQECGLDIG